MSYWGSQQSFFSTQDMIARENHELNKSMFYKNIESAAQEKLAHNMKMSVIEERSYAEQVDSKEHARARDAAQSAINNRREDARIQTANRREDEATQFSRELERDSHTTTQRLRILEMEYRARGQEYDNNLKLVECNNRTRIQLASINKQVADESVSNRFDADETVEDFEFGPSD